MKSGEKRKEEKLLYVPVINMEKSRKILQKIKLFLFILPIVFTIAFLVMFYTGISAGVPETKAIKISLYIIIILAVPLYGITLGGYFFTKRVIRKLNGNVVDKTTEKYAVTEKSIMGIQVEKIRFLLFVQCEKYHVMYPVHEKNGKLILGASLRLHPHVSHKIQKTIELHKDKFPNLEVQILKNENICTVEEKYLVRLAAILTASVFVYGLFATAYLSNILLLIFGFFLLLIAVFGIAAFVTVMKMKKILRIFKNTEN